MWPPAHTPPLERANTIRPIVFVQLPNAGCWPSCARCPRRAAGWRSWASRSSGLPAVDQLEFGRLLYRKIRRLCAFEDLIDLSARTMVQTVSRVRRHQCATSELPEEVDREQRIFNCERDNSRGHEKPPDAGLPCHARNPFTNIYMDLQREVDHNLNGFLVHDCPTGIGGIP